MSMLGLKQTADKRDFLGQVLALISTQLLDKLPTGAIPESEANTVLKAIVNESSSKYLLGSDSATEAQVHHWLSYLMHTDSTTAFTPGSIVECVSFLNKSLSKKSYFAGNEYTLADTIVFVFFEKHPEFLSTEGLPVPELQRWIDHIQNIVVRPVWPKLRPAPTFFSAELVPSAPAPQVEPTLDAAKTVEGKKEDNKKEKAPEREKKAADKASAPAPPAPPAEAKEIDPSQLEIKCGLVVKCWNHPESEKLLCEEIDLGEEKTRTICSGIRAFYTAEQVQGRKVCVVSNLKARKLAGFDSQGMVLCAIQGGHETVQLLEPPAGANVGERVVFTGFTGEPFSSSQVTKKKVLEGILPELRTDADGKALWRDSPMMIGVSPCISSLKNAVIS